MSKKIINEFKSVLSGLDFTKVSTNDREITLPNWDEYTSINQADDLASVHDLNEYRAKKVLEKSENNVIHVDFVNKKVIG